MTDDIQLAELRRRVDAARENGSDSFCLKCQQGFNGPDCPRHWPPTTEDIERAFSYGPTISATDVYVWLCSRLGATRNKDDETLWFAVRDALGEAVTKSTWK